MKTLAALLLLFFLTICLYPQVSRDTLPTTEFPEVIITSHGFSNQTNSNTSNNYLLSEQISLTRPEKISDGLTFLPGIFSVPDGIGGQTLNIRGNEQNRINIYFNGIPLRSNTEGRISVDGLFFTNSDISVEKGVPSLIYGANSSGNVVRIDSRIFTNDDLVIKANSFWGQNNKQSYNALISGKINNSFYYQTSANYFKRKGITLSNNFVAIPSQITKERVNSDQENLEFMGTITYAINNKHYFSLTGVHNRSEFGYPPSTYSPRFRRMDFWHNSMIGLRYSSTFENGISIETNVYYTILDDTLNEYKDKSFSSIKKYSYWNDKTIGFREMLSYPISEKHCLSFSIDYKKDIHDQAWFTKATTKANTILSALEYRGSIIEGVSIVSGTSFNFSNPSYSSTNESITRKNLTNWNYQISTGYVPLNSKYKIHAGYCRTTIFPRMRDLFGDVLIGYTANPELTSEVTNNYDIGFNMNGLNNKIAIQLSTYYSNIKNLITQVKATDTTNKVINLQSAIFLGGELMLKYSPNDEIFGMMSYAYLSAKNSSDGRNSDYIAYRPEHQLRTFISYLPFSYVGFDLTYSFVSKRYYDNQNLWYKLPDYTTFDFGINSKVIKSFTIWFKFNNIFDRNYMIAFDQPQPGREYRIGLVYDFAR